VVKEKYSILQEFFDTSEERGNAFLYQLLELIRNRKEKINFARYVYILSRLEPEKDADTVQREAYGIFSKKMYRWIKDDEECRQLVMAIYLYVYMNREKEEKEDETK